MEQRYGGSLHGGRLLLHLAERLSRKKNLEIYIGIGFNSSFKFIFLFWNTYLTQITVENIENKSLHIFNDILLYLCYYRIVGVISKTRANSENLLLFRIQQTKNYTKSTILTCSKSLCCWHKITGTGIRQLN